MAHSITDLVKRFKQDWMRELEPQMIERACHEVGYVWTERMLGPVMTLQLFFLQILHGNTAMAHLLALFHAGTGMITQVLTAPLRTHDMSQTPRLHPQLSDGDILVADRAFCSYAHLCLILRGNLHAVFRMHQRQLVDFTPNRPYNMPGKKRRKGLPRSQWIRS